MGGLVSIFGIVAAVIGAAGDWFARGGCERKVRGQEERSDDFFSQTF